MRDYLLSVALVSIIEDNAILDASTCNAVKWLSRGSIYGEIGFLRFCCLRLLSALTGRLVGVLSSSLDRETAFLHGTLQACRHATAPGILSLKLGGFR